MWPQVKVVARLRVPFEKEKLLSAENFALDMLGKMKAMNAETAGFTGELEIVTDIRLGTSNHVQIIKTRLTLKNGVLEKLGDPQGSSFKVPAVFS